MITLENKSAVTKTIEVYGSQWNFEVKPGSLILVDGLEKMLTPVQESEVPELGDFRIESINIPDVAPLANISITGRTLQRRPGYYSFFVRIEIEFIRGDGEENTFTSGWLIQKEKS